jgi:hypothetical protein
MGHPARAAQNRKRLADLARQAGLGVELADDLEARFPYIEGSYALQVERS